MRIMYMHIEVMQFRCFIVQTHSRDFTLEGGTEAARVHFFSQKVFLVVALKT